MEELSGRVAVITGAARGVGRALVLECAAQGMRVVAADIIAEVVATDIVAEVIAADIIAEVVAADIIADAITETVVHLVCLFVELVLVDIFAVFEVMLFGHLFFLANVVAREVVADCIVFLIYVVVIRTSFFLFDVAIYAIALITVARLIVGYVVVADNIAVVAFVTRFGFLIIAIVELDAVILGAAHFRDRVVQVGFRVEHFHRDFEITEVVSKHDCREHCEAR